MPAANETPVRFILVPGFWLGAWAWDQVADVLRAAGHVVAPLTLPGLESPESQRAGITLDQHIDAVAAVLREPVDLPTLLIGHSGAGPVIYGATDRVPQLVSRAVYVDSGPAPPGTSARPDLTDDVTEIPLPGWQELEASGSSLAGLNEDDLQTFRQRAVPHPAGPAREPLRVENPDRLSVPVTLINSSFSSETVKELAAAGHPYFAELTRLNVTHADLPTGHWPMWSRPDDLAAELRRAAS